MNGSDKASAAHCWEGFDSARYVERHTLQDALRQWLDDAAQDRRRALLSLVGPPGVGKSWLLARLHQDREQNGKFVLLLNARHLMDPREHDRIKSDFVQRANACCQALRYPNVLLPPMPALIEDLTQRICARCPRERFLVLVDGCDDLASQEEFDTLQREYLRRFFSAGCFRMIVARRLQLTEYSLRRLSTTLRVGVFETAEAESQRNKLLNEAVTTPTDWPQLPNNCAYRWNHPYINCYLLANSVSGKVIPLDTLADCCRSLIERSHLGARPRYRFVDKELMELASMARNLADDWTSGDFRERIGKDLDYTYLLRGLVTVSKADDMSVPRYTVMDGLRELLRALTEKEFRS